MKKLKHFYIELDDKVSDNAISESQNKRFVTNCFHATLQEIQVVQLCLVLFEIIMAVTSEAVIVILFIFFAYGFISIVCFCTGNIKIIAGAFVTNGFSFFRAILIF